MKKPTRSSVLTIASAAAALAGAVLLKRVSYALFHTTAELFSIVISSSVFIIALQTRAIATSAFFGLIGVSLGATGLVDLVHALAYKGMGLLPVVGSNPATQLWIAGRLLLGVSLVAAALIAGKDGSFRFALAVSLYALAVAAITASVFGGAFPDCYVEGSGLTAFKVASEYVSIALFAACLAILRSRRSAFSSENLRFISLGISALIVAEFCFTLYADVYGILNFAGHAFKVAGYYFFYKALVEFSLAKPFRSLFLEAERRISELTRANERIESMQVKLIESEKLGLLGRLAATIAHDIDTPLGVIASVSRASGQLLYELLPGAYECARELDAEKYGFFRHCTLRALSPIADEAAMADGFHGLANRAEGIASSLGERGLSLDPASLGILAELDADPGRGDCLSALGSPDRDRILKLARATLYLNRNNRLATFAAAKVELAVKAINRYSPGTACSVRVETDLRALAESVLALFSAPMQGRVALALELGEAPRVFAVPDQIGLVIWNLIENSLQAMAYRGRLALRLVAKGTEAIVSVEDDGPGIPSGLSDRVFEPFFSTKDAGEGLGLGLNLCRRIVLDHGGRIYFTSRPGRTIFSVALPTVNARGDGDGDGDGNG